MTLGLSLSLTLGAGLHADSGPAVLKRRFEAAWGKTEVFVANASAWDLTHVKAWRHSDVWSIRFTFDHRIVYGLRLERKHRHTYGDLRQHRRHCLVVYGEARQHRLRHLARYADLGTVRKSARFPYWLTQRLAVRHILGYDVTDVNPHCRQLTAAWSLLDDARLQAVVNSPEMVWNGRIVRIVQATLSCDEDSPVWIAQVEVAALPDFAAIVLGDTITLTLGLETFVLVVDGKTLSRESLTDHRLELTAVSPVALLDAPFAGTIRYYQPEAISAQVAVESLIRPVDWQLPDWIIPAGRLMLENVTPLGAARNLVAAIGGIVESQPDGSLVCRRRHPVSIPDYGAASVAHSLFDSDVLSSRAQIAPMRGFNRVTLANEDRASSGASDRIEYVADENDSTQGTVRAYLTTARPVLLTHTGHPATLIEPLGEVTRRETETVEFVEGRAKVRYPVTALVGTVWQHADLGHVTADEENLVSATAGYSLVVITYTTTSLDWHVALAVDEEVQFVLVDA